MADAAQRNKALDLLKLMALVAMTIDHAKYVFPQHELPLVFVGRWAFVLFAMVLAYNVSRAIQAGRTATLKNYFLHLLTFSIISEIPYQLMVPDDRQDINIMPTLLLGFLLILALEWRKGGVWKGLVLWFFTILGVAVQQGIPYKIEYGVEGILLIVAMYGAFRNQADARAYNLFVAVSLALVCAFGNSPIMMMSALCGVGFGFAMLLKPRDAITGYVPKIGKWAYWYYPIHMLAMYGLIRVMAL